MQQDSRYKRTLKWMANTTRTWRNVEDGCTTFLECFSRIVAALEELEQEGDEAAMVSPARGLLIRLKDFDVVLFVHLLMVEFQVT